MFREQRIPRRSRSPSAGASVSCRSMCCKQFLLPGHPEILIVSNIVENGQLVGLGDAGEFWHSDLPIRSCRASARCCMPRSRRGGRRYLFADMHKAWDSLPGGPAQGDRGTHGGVLPIPPATANCASRGNWRPTPERRLTRRGARVVHHPIVRTHLESGARRCSSAKVWHSPRILGLPADESAQLLAELYVRTACALSTSTGIAGRRR
ncbi:TauD/TfdA family dioxygenase [Pseudomonas aeruginosa]|nr:TauD/TfdA family dioxygenase [Pseudomonas aeruginosa]